MKTTVKLLFLLFLWEVPDNYFLFKKCLIIFFFLWSRVKSSKSCNSVHPHVFPSANYLQFKNIPLLKPKPQRLKLSVFIVKEVHLHGSISFIFLAIQNMGTLKTIIKNFKWPSSLHFLLTA